MDLDSRRFRTVFALLLVANDAFMLGLAFLLSYRLRELIPWPNVAEHLDRMLNYLPVMAIFVASNVLVFFVLRLYHLVRATSRVDEFYAVIGGATLGTLLTVFVVPTMYTLLARKEVPGANKAEAKEEPAHLPDDLIAK